MSRPPPGLQPFVPPPEKCRMGGQCAACKQYGLATPDLRSAFDRQRESPFVACTVIDKYGRGEAVPEWKLQQYGQGLRDLWRSKCLEILQKVKDADRQKYFWVPVSTKAYAQTVVDDYYRIITHPSSFEQVKKGLDTGAIGHPDAFIAEMRAIFINCFTYNSPTPAMGDTDPYLVGKNLSLKFEAWVEGLKG